MDVFWLNIAILVIWFLRVAFSAIKNKSQPLFEFIAGAFLCVGALGNVLFGYSDTSALIQAAGLLVALLQGIVWIKHRKANSAA